MTKNNLARILIGIVFLWNLQCAIAFLFWPDRYISSFQLSGGAGVAMLQGLGVLFLMWNVPYAVALWNPTRHRLSLYEAVVMQAIGLIGESFILWNLPTGYNLARASITRFILFDAAGLLSLVVAAYVTRVTKLE